MPDLLHVVEWHCGLCPADAVVTVSTGRELIAHVAQAHEVIIPPGTKLRKVSTMHLDGAHSSSINAYDWYLEDGRVLASQVYSSGIYVGQSFRRRDGEAEG